MTDPIADMLTRIRNAMMARQRETVLPYSRVKMEIAKILEREGFVRAVERVEPAADAQGRAAFPQLRIELKYKENQSVLGGVKRISTPGRRVYYGYREIPKILPSLGLLIISTSQGLRTNTEAREQKLGGEVICEVF
ncbi:MAG: 30S ribosomal protein S8 [Patescibacteria group bacterium]